MLRTYGQIGAVGHGSSDAAAVAVGDAVPDAVGVAVGVAEGVALAVALGVAEPLAVALADGVAEPEGPGSGSHRPKVSLIGSQSPPPPGLLVAVGLPEAPAVAPPVR